MKIINDQNLKRMMHISLTLSSIILSSEVHAKFRMDSNTSEEGNLVGPKSPIFQIMPDKVQRDINHPPQGKAHRNYDELRNEIISKHEKDRPELSQYRRNVRSKNQVNGLASNAEDFMKASILLRQRMKEQDNQITQTGKKMVEGIGDLGEAAIYESVKAEKSRTILLRLKNILVKSLKGIFDR